MGTLSPSHKHSDCKAKKARPSVGNPRKCEKTESLLEQEKGGPVQNIAKGTTDPRIEFLSQVQKQILIKFHFQNLDQASVSKSQSNIIISTKL